MTMTFSNAPQIPDEKLNDILARHYREIGISAVAGALNTATKPPQKAGPEAEPVAATSGVLAELDGENLAA
jgi:hypothetical protein